MSLSFAPKWDRPPIEPHHLTQMVNDNLTRLAHQVQWRKPTQSMLQVYGPREKPHKSTDKAIEVLLRRICDMGAACDFDSMHFNSCPVSDGTLAQVLRYSRLKPVFRSLSMWDHDIKFVRAEVLGRALAASHLQRLSLHIEGTRRGYTGDNTEYQASEACDRFLGAFLDDLAAHNRAHSLMSLSVASNSTDLVLRLISSPHLPVLRTLQFLDYTGDLGPIADAVQRNNSLVNVHMKDMGGTVVPGSPEARIVAKTTANYRREQSLYRGIVRTIAQARVLARIVTPPPTVARRRVGLADMPNEIKANILRYCAPNGTLDSTHAQRLLAFAAKPKDVLYGHLLWRASEFMENPADMTNWCGEVLYRS